jgi:bud emergence protein 1
VSHAELFDKVRARLGPDIQVLRYRTGMAGGAGGAYKDLRDDRELREWLRIEDQKLVLYAEQ